MSQPSPRHLTTSSQKGDRRVLILGSTGSIGTQTLEVIEHLNRLHDDGVDIPRYRVVGLASGSNAKLLGEQAVRFGVRDVALADPRRVEDVPSLTSGFRARVGNHAAESLVDDVECDLVVAAVVGVAGLPATLKAVRLGRDIALANKETLVAAGGIVIPEAARSGSRLLPVDSEHAALWLCLSPFLGTGACPPAALPETVTKVLLTASGGPFRAMPLSEMQNATPEMALRHPTWSMGTKVTIDCASLMNKALELIEAHWLFGIPASRLGAIIHPQSIVHAIAELQDGSVVAQLAAPDMRLPIQQAISFPHRVEAAAKRLDLATMRPLEFEQPDHERFPALALAFEAIDRGGSTGAVMNAANEVAVAAFLQQRIRFGDIPQLVADAMHNIPITQLHELADVLDADHEARRYVQKRIEAGRRGVPASHTGLSRPNMGSE
ncbi:MAG: 1-deoxy-D-xylulose-5-phosphate reductoisomerase [Phycisphaeraceae bacterium]|nr:1-deoxy-D-xylulose-5-phosphate reductoisomerase [Phycisphaeraceae bacterium]MBX3366157.1 1-deoxy-D-xylulose-5-phosphate reductoisomerase [Phycisphaeraceae bacterium]